MEEGGMAQEATRQLDAAAAEIGQQQPELSAFLALDLLNEEVTRKFQPFGYLGKDLIFGIRILERSGRSKTNLGLEKGRPVQQPVFQPGKAFGYIPAGMPHRLTHEFGWWHVNGADEFYLVTPLVNGKMALLIFEAKFPERNDKFDWYCPQCYELLHGREVNIGRVGLEGYWVAEAAAIEEFNADPQLRACRRCGTLHPLAYSVFAPEEEKVW
jgi:hypothetical protein